MDEKKSQGKIVYVDELNSRSVVRQISTIGNISNDTLNHWQDSLSEQLKLKNIKKYNTAWVTVAFCSCDYSYGNEHVNQQNPPNILYEIVEALNNIIDMSSYNCANINIYRNGNDSVDWHADNEELFLLRVLEGKILSFSIGATRLFQIIRKTKNCFDSKNWKAKITPINIQIQSGDIVLQEGALQQTHYHRLLKDNTTDSRINITFRTIKSHQHETCPIYSFTEFIKHMKPLMLLRPSSTISKNNNAPNDPESIFVSLSGNHTKAHAIWVQKKKHLQTKTNEIITKAERNNTSSSVKIETDKYKNYSEEMVNKSGQQIEAEKQFQILKKLKQEQKENDEIKKYHKKAQVLMRKHSKFTKQINEIITIGKQLLDYKLKCAVYIEQLKQLKDNFIQENELFLQNIMAVEKKINSNNQFDDINTLKIQIKSLEKTLNKIESFLSPVTYCPKQRNIKHQMYCDCLYVEIMMLLKSKMTDSQLRYNELWILCNRFETCM